MTQYHNSSSDNNSSNLKFKLPAKRVKGWFGCNKWSKSNMNKTNGRGYFLKLQVMPNAEKIKYALNLA
jgi:hypothetical protein